ncbi:HlyD family secretion protein [Shewanella phaeophyticola]|uniref:HlyD family efflux transporter periplasmic adaptor subunit n=1 Tax=Shewanella phaeophyticola TaxID=2978345 RepID=A0ABT2P2L9_9GAMM|nr:HlyD family efflux transporter periplasmic adaptor subunit [Shewanella sp. KJ10-1]MCT8986896.1 HlyD family efflux transporter periplasmic adaptor subunit [Shewanella sp. KJ10-1]
MNNILKKVIYIFVFIVLIFVFWWGWQYLQDPPLTDGLVSGNGRIEAVEVDVSTKIAGRVDTILAQEGDLVQEQQVVAQINTDQLRAQLLGAEANVASAESQVASALATIEQAKAEEVLTEQELSRAKELVKDNHISKETYDTRVSQVAVAKAALQAAKAGLVYRERMVDAVKASTKEIQTQIDDCVLKSPVTGRVIYRLAEPGEVLGSGGKVLTMINLADVYMEIFVPSAQANRIAIGAEARIKLDVLNSIIPATVSFVSPESQFTPKQVETISEREKLMFRVKVRIHQYLVQKHIEDVKTGVRGVAYIRLTPLPGEQLTPWPDFLQQLLPDSEPISVNQY